MRYVLAVLGALILAVLAWYEISPGYTLNEMRKAAEAGNAAKLRHWVDYQALKVDLEGDIRREISLEADRRGAERDPMLTLGTEIAVALVPVGVELIVSPEAVQAMFDANSAASRTRRGPGAIARSGAAVMPVAIPKEGFEIERNGLSEFKVRTKGKDGAAVFRRYGLSWKLAGVNMPTASTKGPSSRPQ